jgi:hypothetical protein
MFTSKQTCFCKQCSEKYIYSYSDFPTAFFGADILPSPNMKNALFFPQFHGRNSQISMVIKLFVKIEQFQVYDLVTVCFYYASKILCTRYREPVQYIGWLDLLKVACTGLR